MRRLIHTANHNVQDNWLIYWWSDRYNSPIKHKDIHDYTQVELILEWLEHTIRENPKAVLKMMEKEKHGDRKNYQLVTDDEAFNELERKVARGERVTRDEVLSTFFEPHSVNQIKAYLDHKVSVNMIPVDKSGINSDGYFYPSNATTEALKDE